MGEHDGRASGGSLSEGCGQGCLRQSCTVESRLADDRNGKIKSWKALRKNCDGSCYDDLHPSVENNAECKKVLETRKDGRGAGEKKLIPSF